MKAVECQIREVCSRVGADRIFLLTDTHVGRLIGDFLPDAPRLAVEAGEGSKSVAGLEKVWRFLIEEGALRRSVLVNVGGGMVTDLGGFAAATFKRGIGCVNVPTTLLAAVDAAIGGKTGINYAGLKNEVGAFSLPLAVFPLTSLFGTLPEEEWLSGVGEAIKTGLLCSEELFDMTVSEEFIVKREPKIVAEVVRRCAEFKQSVVESDFREGGRRKILNLGHTMGHAIESWMMEHRGGVPHGVAVAYGLRHTLEKSVREAGLDVGVLRRYEAVLLKFFPPLQMNERELAEAAEYMAHDKKNVVAGKPAWLLLEAIGNPMV